MSTRASAAGLSMLTVSSVLSMIYQLFTTIVDYTTFSCTYHGNDPNVANNIENIHNAIHSNIGGSGHMSYPEIAAFDPVFWLHHA